MATYNLLSATLNPNTLRSGDIISCPYSGSKKLITLPPGEYELLCWGAMGGRGYIGSGSSSTPSVNNTASIGGYGGYSCGILSLLNNTTLYLYVGGHGLSSNSTTKGTLIPGGFNGGGNSYVRYYTSAYTSAGSGGGASDIRIGTDSLYARVIVAGGGGGSGGYSDISAKSGGGLKGYSASSTYQATLISAGTGGSFGQGANSSSTNNYNYGAGGGGGGWYGGGAMQNVSDSDSNYRDYNGGGSGYVYTSSTVSNYPSGCLLNSNYYLDLALTYCSQENNVPSYSGQSLIEDDGFILITVKVAYNNLLTGDEIANRFPGKVSFSLPKGRYLLQCWGAQGGYRSSADYGGKGGYANGILTLAKTTTIYCYTGGAGNTGGPSGGFNGGGKRYNYNGGGGASDIRIGNDSLYARVIVAGGGGSDGAANKTGMYGGGTDGGSSTENYGTGGYGGTLTSVADSSWQTSSQSTSTTTQAGAYAGFGFGGNGIYYNSGYGGAGGGGWYGGAGAYPDSSGDDDRGGGGGSGYVYTSDTASNYPSGCLLNNSYYLENAIILSGDSNFSTPDGTTSESGHSGDGYVKITVLSLNPYFTDNALYYDILYDTKTEKFEHSMLSSLNTAKSLSGNFIALKNIHIKFHPSFFYSGNNINNSDELGEIFISKLEIKDGYYHNIKEHSEKIYLNKSLSSVDFYFKPNDIIYILCYYRQNNTINISNIHIDIPIEIEELNYTPIEIPALTLYTTPSYSGSIYYFYPTIIDTREYLTYYSIKSGASSGKDAGDYSTVVSLNDINACKWTDGTTEDKTVLWHIELGNAVIYFQEIHYAYLNQKTILKYFYTGDDPSKLLFTANNNNIKILHNSINKTIEFMPIGEVNDIIAINGSTKLDNNYLLSEWYTYISVVEKYNKNKIKLGLPIIIPYTGDSIEIDLPKGKYHLLCCGGHGGFREAPTNSLTGGSVEGILTLNHTTKLYCYAGGSGFAGGPSGGFNGGGARDIYNGGGGASDIRIGNDSLYARVIVAGGGGSDGGVNLSGGLGGFNNTDCKFDLTGINGGVGGGLDGVSNKQYQIDNKYNSTTEIKGIKAGFGFGGNGITYIKNNENVNYGGAGGGGWYGGAGVYSNSSYDNAYGGGGGSSFALSEEYGKYCPKNYLLGSDYFLKDVQSTDGANWGDGYIKITPLECPSKYYIKKDNQWKPIKLFLLKKDGTWKQIYALSVIK